MNDNQLTEWSKKNVWWQQQKVICIAIWELGWGINECMCIIQMWSLKALVESWKKNRMTLPCNPKNDEKKEVFLYVACK